MCPECSIIDVRSTEERDDHKEDDITDVDVRVSLSVHVPSERVRTSAPVSVMRMVCSACALRAQFWAGSCLIERASSIDVNFEELTTEDTVHPSSKTM